VIHADWEQFALQSARIVLDLGVAKPASLSRVDEEEWAEVVLDDLEWLGLVKRLVDLRIQMPDVYRIAFGVG